MDCEPCTVGLESKNCYARIALGLKTGNCQIETEIENSKLTVDISITI